MRFMVDGIERDFTPIKAFRQTFGLPPTFGVQLFEPKDYTDLASIEEAGAELITVRIAVLRAMSQPHTLAEWMQAVPKLVALFNQNLVSINEVVNLKEVEIDFAAAGFGDVLQAVIYELIRARAANHAPPPFESIYRKWMYSTVKISQTVHLYPYVENVSWEIQILTHVYGRFGMIVRTADAAHYLVDPALGCPAEGYMATLLAEVAAALYRAA